MKVSSHVAVAFLALGVSAPVRAENRPINTERSTLTVLVYKSGFFSAFADDHVIRAPIASGSISTDAPLGVDISVPSASLTVLDPSLPANKRSEVQTRMLGPEVLDSAKFPEIAFTATTIGAAGADRWTVTGRLTIHGQTRPITFSVALRDGHYLGTVDLKQRDFGIQPISIVGGTVKVKDELKIEFDIVPR